MNRLISFASPRSLRTLLLIWLGWAVVMLGFQGLVERRLQPQRPDNALSWTANETGRRSQNNKPYLMDPFMNRHVSWDSEFYLSIATGGYDDPDIRVVKTPEGDFAMNYAFFPLYPTVMSVVRQPLRLFGLSPIATSTLAGVLVSLVSTFFGMLALYDLTRDELGDEGGIRTAFYLLIFPTSFFLAQVYTEALFIALAFSSLALARRQHLLWAGILAALAAWTRATGLVLALPIGIAWLQSANLRALDRRTVLRALPVLLPLAAYLLWNAVFGAKFGLVEDTWFGRSLFDWERFAQGMEFAWDSIISGEIYSRQIYFIFEFAAVLLAVVASLLTLRSHTGAALFGLGALTITLTSGAPQSWIRYVLVVPSLFILPGRLGRNTVFDRIWTTACLLLLSMQAALFTFDMWVA